MWMNVLIFCGYTSHIFCGYTSYIFCDVFFIFFVNVCFGFSVDVCFGCTWTKFQGGEDQEQSDGSFPLLGRENENESDDETFHT